VWRVYPVEGCHDTRWLVGLWSTQAKVEGIVLKAAWHWGSDSSVVDTLGEQPSAWGSVGSDLFFSRFCRRARSFRDSSRH
jgi:hypothetical protein